MGELSFLLSALERLPRHVLQIASLRLLWPFVRCASQNLSKSAYVLWGHAAQIAKNTLLLRSLSMSYSDKWPSNVSGCRMAAF